MMNKKLILGASLFLLICALILTLNGCFGTEVNAPDYDGSSTTESPNHSDTHPSNQTSTPINVAMTNLNDVSVTDFSVKLLKQCNNPQKTHCFLPYPFYTLWE